MKKYAIITDVHGNLEALNAILEDIKQRNVDEIFSLGDNIDIGPNSKECIDKLIEHNIKSTLGNHELYLIRGTDIEPSIKDEEKEHYKWVKDSLTDKEINYINNLPLYYEITVDYNNEINSNKIILCHYLIENKDAKQPFEKDNLKNGIKLWLKYNDPNKTYIIGHLHKSVDINTINGINNDYIEELGTLTNIEIIDSSGCSYDEYVTYLLIEINKGIKLEKIKVKFDKEKFINKILNTDFPDKKNILDIFYNIKQ